MSDCNVNEIMAAAGCYACLTPEQLEVIQTELLCRIYTNGGGGGTPGGLDQQVQFNDGGTFGGDAGLVYNKTTNLLTAGDLAVSSLTAGSVLFAGAGGLVSQDNANLFWDNTNNRLGIGTNAPGKPLHTLGTGEAVVLIENNSGAAALNWSGCYIKNDVGNLGLFVLTTSANNFQVAVYGTSQMTFESNGAGGMMFNQSNGTAANNVIKFVRSTDASTTITESMRIDGSGNVRIGASGTISSHLLIQNAAAATIGQIIKLAAVPTGDAFRVTSSADAVLMSVDSAGNITSKRVTSSENIIATGYIDASELRVDGSVVFDTSGSDLLIGTTGGFTSIVLGTGNAMPKIGGTTSAFPAFLRSTTEIHVKLADNSALTTLAAGTVKVGGTATINQVTKILQGSDTHDFASVAAGTESAVRTVTITGAVEGDPVFIGLQNSASTPNIGWMVWVSAANTVSYKFYNRNAVAAVDLGNLTYKFFVHQL